MANVGGSGAVGGGAQIGPPMPGSPWFQRLYIEQTPKIQGFPPPPPNPAGHVAREVFAGPPMMGAPWTWTIIRGVDNGPGVIPPAPIGGPASPNFLTVPRVAGPQIDPAIRQFTEIVALILNSLMYTQQLTTNNNGTNTGADPIKYKINVDGGTF